MGFCIFNDRYAVRIIMMIYESGDVSSGDMLRIGSNYRYVIASARNLEEQGIVVSGTEADRPKRTKWTLTEKGTSLARLLCVCHYVSHGWVGEDEMQDLYRRLGDHEPGIRYNTCLKDRS